jgi:predicted cobalt transporter CbtA
VFFAANSAIRKLSLSLPIIITWPDKVTIPSNLITSFRIVSVSTIGIFWGVLGIIVGLLWDKFKLHETNRIVSSSSDTFVS